ncbi:acyl carrier protein [Dyadobacter chenwenxiniae]|uniref:Acyl carrier protein n=1 Tax=Dyadobacter chenwenxiniae TaxID=2906456 RepID=A0A9X1TJT4_9BACT|nr:acyl carrier protein [Dyadobacter chenwenxiniae]MCF0060463.1 acyl carrier protein [Dyadobacter chenwenxiniae]UON86195.1 acyl carrier protein [Dyadobacter chenwenxiniae]
MKEQLRALLAINSGLPFNAITNNAHLSKDLGFDSLDIVDLVIQMEDMFCITIPDDEYHELQTVGQFSDYILRKKASKLTIRSPYKKAARA